MIRRPPRSTHCISSAASDVYKRQGLYKEKEELPSTKKLLEENQLDSLARIFVEKRYTLKDNVHFSKVFLNVLENQGFFQSRIISVHKKTHSTLIIINIPIKTLLNLLFLLFTEIVQNAQFKSVERFRFQYLFKKSKDSQNFEQNSRIRKRQIRGLSAYGGLSPQRIQVIPIQILQAFIFLLHSGFGVIKKMKTNKMFIGMTQICCKSNEKVGVFIQSLINFFELNNLYIRFVCCLYS
eukprot:TRINITY_DN15663_c0_g1_i2.p1 TRINITY_DN15663_c0_g1~~TRINITY_DN15663_c0_g1_i2.p1  ORF type:complete len:238 (+),score=10.86 TRINITY_DN15663_c0_g1_i2:79-792(+)